MNAQPSHFYLVERSAWLAPDAAELTPCLFRTGRLVERNTGAWLHGEGDPVGGLLIVLEGALDLLCHGIGERQVRIGQLGAGAAIGQSAIMGGGPRLVTVIAAAPSVVLTVSDQSLSMISRDHPQIWRAVASLLYGQLRYALQAQADLLTLPPRQRIAARLIDIARTHPSGERLRISQQALGEMTGLTRKTISVAVGRLVDCGVLDQGYREIMIRDPRKLLEIAQCGSGRLSTKI